MARTKATRFGGDQRGNVTILTAVSFVAIVGCLALAVDVGAYFYLKRRQQSATDLAAIAAAGDLQHAGKASAANVVLSGYSQRDIRSIDYGVYEADKSREVDDRFRKTPAAAANAVNVTMSTSVPAFFGRVFSAFGASGAPDNVEIRTTATATTTEMASFAIGTGLADLDGGIANAVLSTLSGSNVSLSAMDYRALANTQVNLFDYASALGSQLNLKSVSYDELLEAKVRRSDAMLALASTLEQTQAGQAAARAARSLAVGSERIELRSLLDFGPYASLAVGEASGRAQASASALSLLSATAQLANGRHQIETALKLDLPNVLEASVRIAVGERPVGTSWFTVGTVGATVHSAQTRLLLKLTVAGQAPLLRVVVPVYLEVASGTAKLTSVTCGRPDVAQSTLSLAVTPGVVDGWIGDVSPDDFYNTSVAPAVAPGLMASIPGLVTVTGRAHAQIANLDARQVGFSYDDILSARAKSTSTTDFTASLIRGLLADLDIRATVLGVGLTVPATSLKSTVAGAATAAATPIDNVVTDILKIVGVRLGVADTWASSIRCDGAVLVE